MIAASRVDVVLIKKQAAEAWSSNQESSLQLSQLKKEFNEFKEAAHSEFWRQRGLAVEEYRNKHSLILRRNRTLALILIVGVVALAWWFISPVAGVLALFPSGLFWIPLVFRLLPSSTADLPDFKAQEQKFAENRDSQIEKSRRAFEAKESSLELMKEEFLRTQKKSEQLLRSYGLPSNFTARKSRTRR